MKKIILFSLSFWFINSLWGQDKKISFSLFNDYSDVYHLALLFAASDGKEQTRVSDMQPLDIKTFEVHEGTAVYVLSKEQEASAMQGAPIRTDSLKPYLVVKKEDHRRTIKLTALAIPVTVNASDAMGTWLIDLRPTPGSTPYLKEFKFIKVEGKRFDGEFYGYPFSGGFLNTDWDKLYFAFTTQDQSGTYYHSGYILGNKVYGITLSENREFVLPWEGVRQAK